MQAKHLRHIVPPQELIDIAHARPADVQPVDPATLPITIYTIPTSICSQRVRLTLEEKGVAYTDYSMNMPEFENLQPWYLVLNPRGLVPTLTFGDRAIFDSMTIMLFVDNYFIGPRLGPSNPDARQTMIAWLTRFDKFPVHYLSFRWQLERVKQGAPDYWTPSMHDNVLRAMERHPEHRDLYQRKLVEWQDIVESVNDETSMQAVERSAYALADDLEAALGTSDYLIGDRFSLADITALSTVVRLQCGCGLTLHDDSKRPRLDAYIERLKRRPSYQPGLLAPYSSSAVFALQGDCWFPRRNAA
jgi:tetrachloro-p-hydroquinone reductive dehalogenase